MRTYTVIELYEKANTTSHALCKTTKQNKRGKATSAVEGYDPNVWRQTYHSTSYTDTTLTFWQ